MNVPPAPMSAPPPPPPKKSSALKWILIGCGGVGFVGLIFCGGCMFWLYNFGKSVIKVHEEVDALVRSSPEVREDIGEVQEVEPEGDQQSNKQAEVVLAFRVKGERGTGRAKARVKFSMTKFTLETVTYETKDGRSVKLK